MKISRSFQGSKLNIHTSKFLLKVTKPMFHQTLVALKLEMLMKFYSLQEILVSLAQNFCNEFYAYIYQLFTWFKIERSCEILVVAHFFHLIPIIGISIHFLLRTITSLVCKQIQLQVVKGCIWEAKLVRLGPNLATVYKFEEF